MTEDGFRHSDAQAVVHEPGPNPQSPERRCAHLVPRRLPTGLDDPVARTDVVEQKIAEGVDDLATQRGGHLERAAVDLRSRRCGLESSRVTNGATHRRKQRVAAHGCRRERALPAGRSGGCHKIGKSEYVTTIVFRICYRIKGSTGAVSDTLSSTARILGSSGIRVVRAATISTVKLVGYPHFVQVRITGKGEQARMLSLPTKASDTRSALLASVTGTLVRCRAVPELRRDIVL